MAFIECVDLIKVYESLEDDQLLVAAIRGIELEINAGQLVSIIGPSGSGKTTLLNLLGGIDSPTSGSIKVGEYLVNLLKGAYLDKYRREMVGILWQFPSRNLFWEMSVIDNVILPMKLASLRMPREVRKRRAKILLDAVGLKDKINRKPGQLSGGEAQRAGLAVALANDPELLLADEPTGELDHQTTSEIIDFLKDLNKNLGKTMIVVTHDTRFARRSDLTYRIRDGRIGEMRETWKGRAEDEDEFIVLVDKDGVIRLPEHLRRRLGIKRHVKIIERDTHLEVIPYDKK